MPENVMTPPKPGGRLTETGWPDAPKVAILLPPDPVTKAWPRTATDHRTQPKVSERLANGVLRALAWVPWLLYVLVALGLLGLVYYELTSEGWRLLLPTLSKKLHKLTVPGLQVLQRYQGWNKIDLANVLALVLEFATFWSWDTVLKQFLSAQPHTHGRWHAERFQRIMTVLALGVIAFDGYLFYRGTQALIWGTSDFSVTTLVATIGWLLLLIIASAISVQLQPLPKKED